MDATFDWDGMGNHLLIAIIALVHVVINHTLIVGATPLIVALEWRGISRQGSWDQLAKRITLITLLITCGLGALAGIGCWFSSAMLAPVGIGNYMRLFFANWSIEWLMFVIQILLMLTYYATWDSWATRRKRWHLSLGIVLSVFSWMHMTIVFAAMGFMMSTGTWAIDSSVLSATSNPIFGPQLVFRTFFSLATAGLYVWLLLTFLANQDNAIKAPAVRLAATWTLLISPLCLAAAYWLYTRVPEASADTLGVGSLPERFTRWQSQFLIIAAAATIVMMLSSGWGRLRPQAAPRFAIAIGCVAAIGLFVQFERAHDFVRRPYLIADYMYSNGVRVDELALLQHEGVLTNSAYSQITPIKDENRLQAGRHVFQLTCTRCHTTNSLNGVVGRLEKLYGHADWDPKQIEALLGSMHTQRKYMPPFPGNADESRALAAYLCELRMVAK